MALKKPKKSDSFPNWHPDFRNPATLPDIKVVRTHFLLNFSSVAIAMMLLFFYAYKEYSLQSLESTIAERQQEFDSSKAENTKNTRMSNDFQKTARKVNELNAFMSVPVLPGELLLDLGENLPEEILLDSINYSTVTLTKANRSRYKTKSIALSGSVIGDPETATQTVSNFSNILMELPTLKEWVEKIELDSLTRNEKLGTFSYRMNIIFKEPK